MLILFPSVHASAEAKCFRCQFALVGGVPTASIAIVTVFANAPAGCTDFLHLYTWWFDRRAERRPNFSHSVGWTPTSSIKIERGQQYRFIQSGGTTWGGTPLTITHPFSPINCPVDSLWRYNLRTEYLPCHIHVPTASIVEITAYKQILSNQRKRRLHFPEPPFHIRILREFKLNCGHLIDKCPALFTEFLCNPQFTQTGKHHPREIV